MDRFLRTATHKALKNHTCEWCLLPINKGENYERTTFIFEGDIYDWKSHRKCAKLVMKLDMILIDEGEGISSEDFIERIKEEYKNLVGTDNLDFKEKLEFVYNHHFNK